MKSKTFFVPLALVRKKKRRTGEVCVWSPPGLELIRYGAGSRPSRAASRVGCVWALVPIARKERKKNWTGQACIDSAQLGLTRCILGGSSV